MLCRTRLGCGIKAKCNSLASPIHRPEGWLLASSLNYGRFWACQSENLQHSFNFGFGAPASFMPTLGAPQPASVLGLAMPAPHSIAMPFLAEPAATPRHFGYRPLQPTSFSANVIYSQCPIQPMSFTTNVLYNQRPSGSTHQKPHTCANLAARSLNVHKSHENVGIQKNVFLNSIIRTTFYSKWVLEA